MRIVKRMISITLLIVSVAGLSGCVAIGAATGAVGGAVLTDGNPVGVVGGAVVGGVIGHTMR